MNYFIWILGYYTLLNAITFLVYAKDKWAAKKDRWRTPEKTLHLLSLFGGWLGAMLAHRYLRHKSQKRSFRVVFWVTVVMHGVGVVGLCVAKGYF